MASRNVIKSNLPDSYYHVYSRGIDGQDLFIQPIDYNYFLALIRRHFNKKATIQANGEPYVQFAGSLDILAYCLMPDCVHFLVYQRDEHAMRRLMQRVMGTYGRYFNTKYHRSGAVFESRYRASTVTSDESLLQISRYIHLLPDNWREYQHSSIRYYVTDETCNWMGQAKARSLFGSNRTYENLLTSFEDKRDDLDAIRAELANTI